MSYQHCRWYDPYPGLAFVLKLIRLMPVERQRYVGERLNLYLQYRQVAEVEPFEGLGNRWYDDIPLLRDSLERLKSAPESVKQQSTDYLLKLLDEPGLDTHPYCA